MNGAAKFFIKEHVLCEFFDVVICTNAPFAKNTRALISVKLCSEKFLVALGFFFHYFSILEPQLDVFDFLSIENSGIFEPNPAIDRILNRAGKYLAIRKVLVTCTRNECTTFDGKRQINIIAFERDRVLSLEPLDKLLLFLLLSFPKLYGIFGVEHAGFVNKFAVVVQAHVGFLSHRLGGIHCKAPLELLRRNTLEHFLEKRRICPAPESNLLG